MSHEETELNVLRRQLDEAFLRDDPAWGIIANKILMIARARKGQTVRSNQNLLRGCRTDAHKAAISKAMKAIWARRRNAFRG